MVGLGFVDLAFGVWSLGLRILGPRDPNIRPQKERRLVTPEWWDIHTGLHVKLYVGFMVFTRTTPM